MIKSKKDLIAGIVLCLFSAAYLFCATKINVFTAEGAAPLNARALPYMWGSFLFIMSVVLILRSVVSLLKEKKGTDNKSLVNEKHLLSDGLKNFIGKYYRVILIFVFLIIYIAFMQLLGFIVMTFVFLTASVMLLGPIDKRHLIIALAIALVGSITLYCIFSKGMHIMLPETLFGGVL